MRAGCSTSATLPRRPRRPRPSDGIRAPAAWGCTSSPGPALRTAGPCSAAASTCGRTSTSAGPPPRRRVGRPPRPQCRASQPPPQIPHADPPRTRWSRCRTPGSPGSARRPHDRRRAGADRRRPHRPRESWMNPARRTARIAGWFFIATFVTSIPAQFFCYEPVLQHADYIVGAGATTRVSVGAFLEVLLAIAGIGTAVVLFPILKRQSEAIALGYVASRVVESTIIAVGIVSVLSVVTLQRDLAAAPGADRASLLIAGRSLVAFHDWTFLLGPGLLAGLGNGLMLGYLMYRSGLVPRGMTLLGLIGGPLIFASGIAVLLGVYDQVSIWSAIATIPEFLWELSLGIYLIVKGFRPSPILDGPPEPRPRHYDRELGIPASRHAAPDSDLSTQPAEQP